MAKIPDMTREEEAEFWKTHSSVDYLDDMEPVEVEFHPRIKGPRDLSRRCPVCDDVLLFRYADRDVADGQITLHRLMEFYCRQGHGVWLAPGAEKLVKAIEAMLALREEPTGQLAEMPEPELVAA
jgi:hypothetical protein